jgi:opacity protein-like surface antigen
MTAPDGYGAIDGTAADDPVSVHVRPKLMVQVMNVRQRGPGSEDPTARRGGGWAVVRIALCVAAGLTVSATARAQEPRELKRQASFTLGASFGDGNTALASMLGLGFAWASRLGVEIEVSHARKLDFTIDLCPPPRVCIVGGHFPVTGRTLSLVPQLAIRLMPASSRVQLYALAGAGVGHIRQRYFLTPPSTDADRPELTRSSLAPALSVGGGAAVSVTRRLAVGVDLRSLHLRDDEGEKARFIMPAGWLDTVRIGARVAWRF